MTPEEYIAALEANPEEREKLARQARQSLDAAGLKQIADHFLASGNASLGATFSEMVNEDWSESRLEAETAETAAGIADRASQLEAAGVSQFDARAQARGEAGVEAGASDDPFAGQEFILPEPLVRIIGNDVQSQAEADQILQIVEAESGRTFTDLQQAYDQGVFESPELRNIVSLMAEPEGDPRGLGVRTRGGQEVFIPGSIANTAMEQFSLGETELVKTVRMAEVYGFETAAGQIAWQPFNAIMRAHGFSYGDPEERASDANELLTRQAELLRRERQLEKTAGSVPQGDEQLQQVRDELAEIDDELRAGRDVNRVLRPRQIGLDWKEGMELYDSETLAFFHAIDPNLASTMANTDVLSTGEARLALSYMAMAGLSGDDPEDFAANMAQLGFLDPYAKQLVASQQRAAASAGGGSGRTILRPDPVAIRQGAKDMYRNLYMEDPSEAQLDSLTAQISASIAGAPDDMSVSGEARLREAVEGQPQYQEFYGNKPEGMSEEEYQGMHRSAQQSMLGSELATNEPARIGMREGQYQTTVGATLGTAEAWDNSTFMGRLAKAAQVTARNT